MEQNVEKQSKDCAWQRRDGYELASEVLRVSKKNLEELKRRRRQELFEKAVQSRRDEMQLQKRDKQLTEITKQLTNVEGQLQERDGQLREMKQRLADMERQLRERDGELTEKTQTLTNVEGKLQERDEQLREMKQRLTDIERHLRQRDGELTEKTQTLTNVEGQLRQRDEELTEKTQTLTNVEGQLRKRDKQVRGLKKQLTNVEGQLQERDGQLREVTEQLGNVRGELQAEADEAKSLRDLVDSLEKQLTEKEEQLNDQLQERDGQLRERTQQLTNVQRQLQERIEEISSLERRLRTRGLEVNELQMSLSTIQRMSRDPSCKQASDWVISRDQIQVTKKVLGKGAWGTVVEGWYCGCAVAVKQLHKIILSPLNEQLFMREMEIASRCRHPCLLQFIGATNDDGGDPLFVTELMESSLRNLLQGQPLSTNELSIISLDVARALNYLHHKQPRPIIHRDINSANVLLWKRANQWRAKVSDYGTANFMRQVSTACPGTPIYSAPEAFTAVQTVKVHAIYVIFPYFNFFCLSVM